MPKSRIDKHWTPAKTNEQGIVSFELPKGLSDDRLYTVEVRLFGPSKAGPQYRILSEVVPKGHHAD